MQNISDLKTIVNHSFNDFICTVNDGSLVFTSKALDDVFLPVTIDVTELPTQTLSELGKRILHFSCDIRHMSPDSFVKDPEIYQAYINAYQISLCVLSRELVALEEVEHSSQSPLEGDHFVLVLSHFDLAHLLHVFSTTQLNHSSVFHRVHMENLISNMAQDDINDQTMFVMLRWKISELSAQEREDLIYLKRWFLPELPSSTNVLVTLPRGKELPPTFYTYLGEGKVEINL